MFLLSTVATPGNTGGGGGPGVVVDGEDAGKSKSPTSTLSASCGTVYFTLGPGVAMIFGIGLCTTGFASDRLCSKSIFDKSETAIVIVPPVTSSMTNEAL